MFKIIQINDFQIFLELNKERARIDELMKISEIKDSLNYDQLLEVRLKEHFNIAFEPNFEAEYIL